MERAEVIFDRSGDLAARPGPSDVGTIAIDLLRAAGDDVTTLRHALRIGRSRIRRDPDDLSAKRGVGLLEAVISFLGHRQRPDEAGSRTHRVPGRHETGQGVDRRRSGSTRAVRGAGGRQRPEAGAGSIDQGGQPH